MDIGQGLALMGNSIANGMQQYHKEHENYDQQMQLADALSRLGINQQGQITPIDPTNKDKTVQPIIDSKALQTFQTASHDGQVKATGALEAINRIALHGLAPVVGQIGQEQLKAHQLANQRFDVQAGGQTIPATGGQAIQAGLEQQRINLAKEPKSPTQHQTFLEQQKLDESLQKKIQSSPEYKFQQQYKVFPSQVLSPDVVDPAKQQYNLFFKPDAKSDAVQVQPDYDQYGIPRVPQWVQTQQKKQGTDAFTYWQNASDIYRFNPIERNQDGVKTVQNVTSPEGSHVNIGGQSIPYNDIQGIRNRHDEVLSQAKAAIAAGKDPNIIAKMYGGLGYDPNELAVR